MTLLFFVVMGIVLIGGLLAMSRFPLNTTPKRHSARGQADLEAQEARNTEVLDRELVGSIPFMVTGQMTTDLLLLGYSPADIRAMTPEVAHQLISAKQRKI